MHEEAMKAMEALFTRREQLIAEGKLPDVPGVWERFAYLGHKTLHGFYQPDEKRHYRCVTCMCEWMGRREGCPGCQSDLDTFQLNIDRTNQWECLSCKHQWRSDNGTVCPACNAHHKLWRYQVEYKDVQPDDWNYEPVQQVLTRIQELCVLEGSDKDDGERWAQLMAEILVLLPKCRPKSEAQP